MNLIKKWVGITSLFLGSFGLIIILKEIMIPNLNLRVKVLILMKVFRAKKNVKTTGMGCIPVYRNTKLSTMKNIYLQIMMT